MTNKYVKLVVLLVLLSLVTSTPLLSYDPTTGPAVVTSLSKSDDSYKWLYKRFVHPDYSIESVSLDQTETNNILKVSYNAATLDLSLKAVSSNYDCAILSASNTNLLVVKFTADVTLVEDLIATDFLDVANWADADAAVAKSYQVSDDCSAFSADSGTYHFDDSITAGGATKFVPDDATTWTAPVFSSDFNFAAANDGIYKYTPKTADDPGMYSRVHSVTLLANKRIWTTATAIIIVSWASTGTDDMKDYKVHSFLRPTGIQTVYTLVGSIEGQFFSTVAHEAPQISVSSGLRVVSIYGKSSTTAFFSKVRTFNYDASTSIEVTLPAWTTQTESAVQVSDDFIYVRNLVDKEDTTDKYHGAFYVNNLPLNIYFPSRILTVAEQPATYLRSMLYNSASGQLRVLRELNAQTDRSGVATLEQQIYTPEGQVFSWDRTDEVSTAVITGAGTSFAYVDGRPVWFSQTLSTPTSKVYQYVTIHSTSNAKIAATLSTLDENHNLKALSKNLRCAVIHDSTGAGQLKVYNFVTGNTLMSNTAISTSRTVLAALYDDIDLEDAATTFAVSDNCNVVKINNIVIRWLVSSYVADTLPNGVTLGAAGFSEDFSILVTNSGIYSYNTSDDSYKLARTETYHTTKSVWRDNNKLVIFSYKPSSVAGVFDFKLETNILHPTQITNITELEQVSGQSKGAPHISVSPRMTRIIVSGIDTTDDTKMNYVAKRVDWMARIVRDISLTSAITGAVNQITVSEDFLYARNQLAPVPKHYGYVFLGNTLVQSFNENAHITSNGYSRTVIISDPEGKGRMVIAVEYENSPFIRLSREFKKDIKQVINPNQNPPYQMTFDYVGSLQRQQSPLCGRWAWTSASGEVLNWVEYDTTQQGKKKTITQESLTAGSQIVATSPLLDCAVLLTTVGQALDTVHINNTGTGTATTTNHWATVVKSADITSTNLGIAKVDSQIQVGNGCWAFRVNNFVYVKPAAAGAFVKSAVSETALQDAIFDSTLKFALVSDKIYKYGTTDYVNILNVTGLKENVELYSTFDSTKFFIHSWQVVQGAHDTVMMMFVGDGTTYSPVTLQNQGAFKTLMGAPLLSISPEMETFVLAYPEGTLADPSVGIYISKVNSTSRTVERYSVPPIFYTLQSPTIALFEDYIYASQIVSGSQRTEYFFKLDKENLKIVEITRRPISAAEFSTFRGGIIFEEDGLLSVIYDSEPASDTVVLIRRLVGSPALQGVIRGIRSQDAGFLVENGQIRLCPPGCIYCVNSQTCSTCSTGFVLNQVTLSCVRCAPLCATCSESDLAACTTCVSGYYVSSGSCLRCHQTCVTCSGPSINNCDSCKVGFYAVLGVCAPCTSNCISCNSMGICLSCKPGYVYHGSTNSCVKCISGCTVCNPNAIFNCVSCGTGFEPVTVNDTITQCKRCPPKCMSCEDEICTECRPGFRLINNQCTDQCQLPCKECTETSSTICTSCIGGYTFENETCIPDLTCNDDKDCTSCPIGYNLVLGECVECNGGDNCLACDNKNIDQCASCVRGFYLTETLTCATCNVAGCANCANAVFCNQCNPGFILQGSGTSSKCVRCHESCATCLYEPKSCDLCATGYTKKGTSCVNNNNIEILVELDAVFADLTTQQYLEIEEGICTIIQIDNDQVIITSLRNGSIIVELTINVNNPDQLSTLESTLSGALAQNLTLAGLTILDSAVTANRNINAQIMTDDGEAQRYRNIAIIVGIVIPVVLIIFFVILIILMKKGVICNSNEPSRVRDSSLQDINVKGEFVNSVSIK